MPHVNEPADSRGRGEAAVEQVFAAVHGALAGGAYRDALIRRETLYLPGLFAGLEAGLPSLSDIELVLAQAALPPGDVRVYSGRESLDLEQLKFVNYGKIEPQMLVNAALLGNTIVINHVERLIHKAHLLSRSLEEWHGDAVEIAMVSSFGSDSGLPPHHDRLHVMIFQLEGSKEWTFHGQPVAPGLPNRMKHEPEPARKLTLNAGDFLYIPAGQRHVCQPDGYSVHLSVVTHCVNGAPLREKLKQALLDSVLLKEDVPALLGADNDRLMAEKYRAHMHELIDQMEIGRIFEQERKRRRLRPRITLRPRRR